MDSWRKATYSVNCGQCIEVGNGIKVRDSKNNETTLYIKPQAWKILVAALKNQGTEMNFDWLTHFMGTQFGAGFVAGVLVVLLIAFFRKVLQCQVTGARSQTTAAITYTMTIT